MNFLCKKEKGNFTVEFAIVGVAFSFLIAFSGEIITKLAIRGKLDRMAYSGATIIAERTQLFGEDDFDVDKEEGESNYKIIMSSLSRTMSNFSAENFGYSLDRFTYSTGDTTATQNSIYTKGQQCTISIPSTNMLITSGWGRSLNLYQVTLCYEADSWFGDLINKVYSNRVHSYSIAIGR